MSLNILISGGGIAGPALAFWLHRHGHTATIVEQAPAVRSGGQAVDFRGPSLTVLDKMGLLDQVRASATNMGPVILVDEHGEEAARLPSEVVSGELEIIWGNLAQILHEAVRNDVEYRFSTRITNLVEDGSGVHATFSDGTSDDYDLVIGADGLHSGLRELLFGPEEEFVTSLGRWFCFFDMQNHLRLDHVGMAYEARNGTVVQQAAGPDEPARASLWLTQADPAACNHRDLDQAKQLFVERFAGEGWEIPRILEALRGADPFYFDSLAQVHLPDYSKGRAVLIGDAAWCASPRAGMGTSLAIVGAYVLAHELRAANGDYAAAFARYQGLLTPYVARCQKLAVESLRLDNPHSVVARIARKLAFRALRIPLVSRLVAQQALVVGRSFALPTY